MVVSVDLRVRLPCRKGPGELACGDDNRGQGLLLRFAGVERMPCRGIVGNRSFMNGPEIIVSWGTVSLFDWEMGASWSQASRRGTEPPLLDATDDESEMVFFRTSITTMTLLATLAALI